MLHRSSYTWKIYRSKEKHSLLQYKMRVVGNNILKEDKT